MVDLRAAALRFDHQLHGPGHAFERGHADHLAVRTEPGAVREHRVRIRLGLCGRLAPLRRAGGPTARALGVSFGPFALVAHRHAHRPDADLRATLALPGGARTLRRRTLALRDQD